MNGRCECNRVQYKCTGPISDFSHCHCSQCRRLHGAAFGTFAGVPREHFNFTAGENDLKIYASSETTDRYFCHHCGSSLMVDYKPDPDVVYLCMGTLEDDPGLELPKGYHQFVGSIASWHQITDDLPQYEEEIDDDE